MNTHAISRQDQIVELTVRLLSSGDPDQITAAQVILDLLASSPRSADQPFPGLNPVLEMARHATEGVPDGPWLYRPNNTDDWGEVRSPDGYIVARASLRASREELAAHREARTDPCEKTGKFIARARTLIPAMAREIARLQMAGAD